jgi:hypothetical protein
VEAAEANNNNGEDDPSMTIALLASVKSWLTRDKTKNNMMSHKES